MIERLRWFYRAWRYRLKLERPEIRWLLQNLGPGDVAVDIGAHKGAYTYWMRRRVGRDGRVFAFEPQPELAGLLRRLMQGAGFTNVVVEEQGLSSQPGTMKLKIPGRGSSPSASFENTQDSVQAGHSVPVEVTTLDRYMGEAPAFRVRLLKCDAEGHELEVFRGARQLLTRDRPKLLFECESRHLRGGEPGEVFAFLEGLGYRGIFLSGDAVRDINEFDASVHQARPGDAAYINNFIFTPAARHAD